MRSAVVLLAAGTGRRYHRRRPKQFEKLQGEPLFLRSLRVFSKLPSVREIVVVTLRDRVSQIERRVRPFTRKKKLFVVEGGTFRGASVRNGVRALTQKSDVILIHDAARPMVNADIVRRVEKAAFKAGVALAAWPLPDTLKWARSNGRVRKTIPRKDLWLAQTPQGFRWDIAHKCLLKPSASATDDAELAQRKGYAVQVVEGSAVNLKITRPDDLILCQKILS